MDTVSQAQTGTDRSEVPERQRPVRSGVRSAQVPSLHDLHDGGDGKSGWLDFFQRVSPEDFLRTEARHDRHRLPRRPATHG